MNTRAGENTQTLSTLAKLDNTKLKRIIIKIRDEKEIEMLRRLEGENLPKAFRNSAYSVTKEIIATFTKKQTDKIVLIIATLEGKETLKEI